MSYDNILFDLDGTLTDPAIGITNSVMYALKKFGIEVADRRELFKFIGPPLEDSFIDYYGLSPKEASAAVGYYREYFREKGIFQNQVYPDIEELLKALADANKTLLVATSKPQVFAVKILKHFALSDYFTFVAGSELNGTRVIKAEVIEYALLKGNISDKPRTIMVGDRKHDVVGAKKVGIKSIGVSFGYGGRAELELAGADYIVDCPLAILEICR